MDKQISNYLFHLLSRFLERIGYYGIRSLLVVYLMDLNVMDDSEVFTLYSGLTILVYLSYVLGGFVSDFVWGEKTTKIVGNAFQMLSCILLYFFPDASPYLPIFLFGLGAGIYSPAILSSIGRNFQNRKKVMDSAFLIFYMVVNLGAFIGALVFGLFGAEGNFGWACLLGILVFAGSIVFAAIPSSNAADLKEGWKDFKVQKNTVGNIFLLVGASALFWVAYEWVVALIYDGLFDLRSQNELSDFGHSFISQYINFIVLFVLGVALSILWWMRKPFSIFRNFTIGFAAFTMLVLVVIASLYLSGVGKMMSIIFVMILFSTAEVFTSTVIYSYIARKVNPKYLSLIIGGCMTGMYLIMFGVDALKDFFFDYQQNNILVYIALGIAVTFFIVFLILSLVSREQNVPERADLLDN